MRFVHVKTGERVKFLRLGMEEKTCNPTVVYETMGNDVWTRPASEFFDGRFMTELAFDNAQKAATDLGRPSKRKD